MFRNLLKFAYANFRLNMSPRAWGLMLVGRVDPRQVAWFHSQTMPLLSDLRQEWLVEGLRDLSRALRELDETETSISYRKLTRLLLEAQEDL